MTNWQRELAIVRELNELKKPTEKRKHPSSLAGQDGDSTFQLQSPGRRETGRLTTAATSTVGLAV